MVARTGSRQTVDVGGVTSPDRPYIQDSCTASVPTNLCVSVRLPPEPSSPSPPHPASVVACRRERRNRECDKCLHAASPRPPALAHNQHRRRNAPGRERSATPSKQQSVRGWCHRPDKPHPCRPGRAAVRGDSGQRYLAVRETALAGESAPRHSAVGVFDAVNWLTPALEDGDGERLIGNQSPQR